MLLLLVRLRFLSWVEEPLVALVPLVAAAEAEPYFTQQTHTFPLALSPLLSVLEGNALLLP